MNDYIILFDENGQPYIEHKYHKYLKRIDNYFGTGKHLYLYSQADIDKFNKTGKRTVLNKIRDKIGWDEKSAYEDAKDNRDTVHYLYRYSPRVYNLFGDSLYDANNQVAKARDDYLRTPLYAIESIRKYLDTPLKKIRSKYRYYTGNAGNYYGGEP